MGLCRQLLPCVASCLILAQSPQPWSPAPINKDIPISHPRQRSLEQIDGRVNDPALTAYLEDLASRLAQKANRAAFEVRITRGERLYAVGDPARLYLSAGLLARIESEAELAGLVAHVLAHHRQAPASTPSIMAIEPCVLASVVVRIDDNGVLRGNERGATQSALELLKESGYDPAAVLDLLSKLAYENPVFAKAIVPDDLIALRASLELDDPPPGGYRIDTSEFIRFHGTLASVHQPPHHRANPSQGE